MPGAVNPTVAAVTPFTASGFVEFSTKAFPDASNGDVALAPSASIRLAPPKCHASRSNCPATAACSPRQCRRSHHYPQPMLPRLPRSRVPGTTIPGAVSLTVSAVKLFTVSAALPGSAKLKVSPVASNPVPPLPPSEPMLLVPGRLTAPVALPSSVVTARLPAPLIGPRRKQLQRASCPGQRRRSVHCLRTRQQRCAAIGTPKRKRRSVDLIEIALQQRQRRCIPNHVQAHSPAGCRRRDGDSPIWRRDRSGDVQIVSPKNDIATVHWCVHGQQPSGGPERHCAAAGVYGPRISSGRRSFLILTRSPLELVMPNTVSDPAFVSEMLPEVEFVAVKLATVFLPLSVVPFAELVVSRPLVLIAPARAL